MKSHHPHTKHRINERWVRLSLRKTASSIEKGSNVTRKKDEARQGKTSPLSMSTFNDKLPHGQDEVTTYCYTVGESCTGRKSRVYLHLILWPEGDPFTKYHPERVPLPNLATRSCWRAEDGCTLPYRSRRRRCEWSELRDKRIVNSENLNKNTLENMQSPTVRCGRIRLPGQFGYSRLIFPCTYIEISNNWADRSAVHGGSSPFVCFDVITTSLFLMVHLLTAGGGKS